MNIGTVLLRKVGPSPRGGDVMAEALDRGWVFPFAKGQYIYGPEWTHLARTFLDNLRTFTMQELGFQEWIFPRIIPRSALTSFCLTQYAPGLLQPMDATGEEFLDPVQCVSLYQMLRDAVIAEGKLPIKIVECMGGWTWRRETDEALDGMYRAREFLRVEHVYVGTPQQVRDARMGVREAILTLLVKLGLSYQVVVGNGCMDIPSIIQRRENARMLEEVPVQDIEIPIRGCLKPESKREALIGASHDRLSDERLFPEANDEFYLDTDEICGCSVEGDHLTSSFNITRGTESEPLWSGCVGLGLNRLVLGFLYQHGFEEASWPRLAEFSLE